MNDHAYDISYLLESESVITEARSTRVAKAPVAVPRQPSIAEVQEALARELLQVAEIHEALIQQYLRMNGAVLPGSRAY